VSAISVEVVSPDKCLRGEGLVWLIGVVVCLPSRWALAHISSCVLILNVCGSGMC